ncbi:MAG TPA: DUF1844 domain-containing protein [Myxococcaceae bacterium]|jgi:hypothetical protein|nr:DUF1844 domain-containing protein [Myxococcaceae bacterium]
MGSSSGRRGESFVIDGPPGERGPIDFTAFLLGLASTALIHMGASPHPDTGRTERDEALARQSLDLLALLREKTRGNLSPAEDRFFDALLTDLRLKFIGAGPP